MLGQMVKQVIMFLEVNIKIKELKMKKISEKEYQAKLVASISKPKEFEYKPSWVSNKSWECK